MAKTYPAPPTLPSGGKTFRMRSAKIGKVNYNNCLGVNVSPEGIRLAAFPIFRFAHPPILIPFSAIHNATTRKFLWAEFVQFEVGEPKITTIQLQKKLFEALGDMKSA